MTTTETITYDGVTRGFIPIRLGDISGPVIGELVSFYSDGEHLMGNCVLDGEEKVIRLAQEGNGMAASYVMVSDTVTGIPHLEEGSPISFRTTGKKEQGEEVAATA